MEKVTVPIKGMHCASCALVIEKALSKAEGVKEVEVNYGTEKAAIEYDRDRTSLAKINETIKPFGYEFIDNTSNLKIQPEATNQAAKSAQMEAGIQTQANIVKQERLRELQDQKVKIDFVLPVAIMVFLLMMWEIASKNIPGIPYFFIPHELYSTILLILSTIVLFWIGRPFLKWDRQVYKIQNCKYGHA